MTTRRVLWIVQRCMVTTVAACVSVAIAAFLLLWVAMCLLARFRAWTQQP